MVTPIDVVTALRSKGHQTAVVAATGPSLTADDLAAVRDRALVIGVSDVGRFYPWVDAVYAADARWWKCHAGLPEYAGLKASIEREAGVARRDHPWPDVAVFTHYGTRGLEVKHADGLRTNDNSGAQAINLAVHAAVKLVLLLGFDMDVKPGAPSHFFGEHPDAIRSRCWEPYTRFRPCFDTMKPGLQAAGVEVINCSRETVLKTFPRMALADALRVAVAA